MNQIYVFLIENDVWIYILAGIGLFWYLGQLIGARRELRQAMFGLERERGLRRQRRAISIGLILALIIVAVTYVNLEVAPDLPEDLLKPPTPTPDLFITPLSSPTPINTPEDATPILAPTVTLASGGGLEDREDVSEATPEPIDTPPALIGECSSDVSITSPPNGTQISGSLTFFGTAAGNEVVLYDLEAFGISTELQWQSLLESRLPTPILDGILGSADMTGWIAGTYTIKLSVFDQEGAAVGECAVQLEIINQD